MLKQTLQIQLLSMQKIDDALFQEYRRGAKELRTLMRYIEQPEKKTPASLRAKEWLKGLNKDSPLVAYADEMIKLLDLKRGSQ